MINIKLQHRETYRLKLKLIKFQPICDFAETNIGDIYSDDWIVCTFGQSMTQ